MTATVVTTFFVIERSYLTGLRLIAVVGVAGEL
jgi:hypothetical protein